MAEVLLLPVAIKLAFFAGKCLEMEKRPKQSRFWSIADHFETIKEFHFTAPLKPSFAGAHYYSQNNACNVSEQYLSRTHAVFISKWPVREQCSTAHKVKKVQYWIFKTEKLDRFMGI